MIFVYVCDGDCSQVCYVTVATVNSPYGLLTVEVFHGGSSNKRYCGEQMTGFSSYVVDVPTLGCHGPWPSTSPCPCPRKVGPEWWGWPIEFLTTLPRMETVASVDAILRKRSGPV